MARNRPGLILWAGGFSALWLAYITVFTLSDDDPFWNATFAGLRNAGSAALWGGLAALALARFAVGTPLAVKALWHAGLGFAFGFLWYLTVLILLGLKNGSLAEGFSVRPFASVAFYWQMLQGITLYTAIALGTQSVSLWKRLRAAEDARDAAESRLARLTAPGEAVMNGEGPDRTRAPESGETGDANEAGRILVKQGDEIVSLDPAEVVRLSGAGDYTEVTTRQARFLSGTTLAAFEQRLGPRFVRVHRSHIVNLDALDRAEPAGGGRLTLHLSDGSAIATSRAGARPIRERAR
jgi:DNA-binding LytR/AlgR family response regulator